MSTGSTGEVGSSHGPTGSSEVHVNAAATDSAARTAAEATAASTVNSLGDLEKKYPAFYKKFINGLAQLIINQTGDAMKRVIKTMKQYEQ